jgi:hypothetical protein
MPAVDEGGASARRRQTAMGLLLSGIALILVSFLWPSLPIGKPAWSEDQAKEYQSASATLHLLSHKYENELNHARNGALPTEFQQAKDKYEHLRQQLDEARQGPSRLATLLFCGGLLFSLVGAAIYYSSGRE